MTKEQAASQLGCGVRTLQRMMSKGEIQYTTRRNPHGGMIDSFTEAEIERVKGVREKAAEVVHAVTSNGLQKRATEAAMVSNGHQNGLGELVAALTEALKEKDTTRRRPGAA